MIVILTQDLMMTSAVSAVSRSRSLDFKSASGIDRVIKLVAENQVSTLFVDLQLPDLDLQALMAGLTGSNPKCPQVIAYAQHVHVELLARARQLGIEQVLTRGQVHGNLETLIPSRREG